MAELALAKVNCADVLSEVRRRAEEGLVVLTVVVFEYHPVHRVLVVLRDPSAVDPDRAYHCHRYWQAGRRDWSCSLDRQRADLAGVWAWLSAPSAKSAAAFVRPG